jgi:hypothetical protein
MEAAAKTVRVDEDSLHVALEDGRALSVPLVWLPTLLHASEAARADVEIMTGGDGLRWPALDLDISVAALLAGRRERTAPAKDAAA